MEEPVELVTWWITFVAVWLGCTIGFGPLGFLLGWLPAQILATIAARIWFVLVALVGVVVLLAVSHR